MSSHPTLGEPLAPLNDESSEPGTPGRAQAIPRNKRLTLPASRSGSAARSRVGSQQPAQEPVSLEALREQSNIEQQQQSLAQLPRAYRIPEVCRATGLGRTTIYEAIKSRALIARRYRRCTVVLADDLAAFLRNLPTTSHISTGEVISSQSAPAQPDGDKVRIPALLDRRSLSTEEEKLLAALLAVWANAHELQGLLAAASAIVRARFIAAILRAVTDEHDSFVGTKP